jgi:hypothetical protein
MDKLFFILIAIVAVQLSSCTKEIDIELEEGDRRLVIDTWFTTEQKVHQVNLTHTANYFSNEPSPKVTGASVQIAGGGDVFEFQEVSPGVYESEPTAQAKMGNEYTLTIDHDGETYEASDFCDTVPNLDWVELYYDSDEDGAWYDFLIWTTELSGYGHYYCWRVLKNGVYVTDTLSKVTIDSDEYLGDGLVFEAFPMEWIWADQVTSGDVLTLEQHNISKQTYDSFIGIMTETSWKGGIFDAPPANIPSNVIGVWCLVFGVWCLVKKRNKFICTSNRFFSWMADVEPCFSTISGWLLLV